MQQGRTNFDATFCGKLPLNQTNLIQPHGVLLVISEKENTILQASENVVELLSLKAEEIIGNSLEAFVDKESLSQLKSKWGTIEKGKIPTTIRFMNNGEDQDCLALIHKLDGQYIIEIDLPSFVGRTQNSFSSVFQRVKQTMSAIDAATTVEEVCAVAATEIKNLSGFDKVMIYSFDEEWNGSVIGEAMEEGMEQYFGLKFPASDVPKPARDMYLKNPYRIIPNREYQPVRLFPLLNPATNTFTNLSGTDLRSVAAVHLEYLKNMNVSASMSTRIVHEGRLWGLIACHHRKPKYLSFEECSVFELLSNILSSKITALHNNQLVSTKEKFNDEYTDLVEQIYKNDNLVGVWRSIKEKLLHYLRADGLIFCLPNMIERTGVAPDDFQVETLRYWLQSKSSIKTMHFASLPAEFDEALQYSDVGSGLLALPIQVEKGIFVLAFRNEAVKTVSWGGNPNEALQFEPNSSVYHPRNSFNQWQETVRNTAKPWQAEEISAAESIRNVLVDFTLNKQYQ